MKDLFIATFITLILGFIINGVLSPDNLKAQDCVPKGNRVVKKQVEKKLVIHVVCPEKYERVISEFISKQRDKGIYIDRAEDFDGFEHSNSKDRLSDTHR